MIFFRNRRMLCGVSSHERGTHTIMFSGYVLMGVAVALLLLSPAALRRFAAWLLGRAFFVENMSAEWQTWRKRAAAERKRFEREFGLQVTDAKTAD